MDPLRLCLIASEVAPLAKTGGLADVTAALARHLSARGHDVKLFVPLYRRIARSGRPIVPEPGLERLTLTIGPHRGGLGIRRVELPEEGLTVLGVDCPELYDRDEIYGGDDEALRFALLGRAALAACQELGWAPDVVHCNDWHAALVPLQLKLLASWESLFARTKTVLTIHNIGYQGLFPAEVADELGLDDARHLLDQVDLAAGRLNFLKTGLLYADVITTVSETYAREIQTPELGMGLDPLLRERSGSVVGIVNGVDYDVWSPERDPHIPRRYSAASLEGKAACKAALLEEMGLPPGAGAPTFGIVSRLVGQKGFELLEQPLPELLAAHDVRVTVLGTGEDRYEALFERLQERFPHKLCFFRGYHEVLAHHIEAGADAFLMPSRYEPCGLNQMYSLRYGTVPIVRRTGGLADTVRLFDPGSGAGTGIVFDHFNADAMRWALSMALGLYHAGRPWRRMQLNGMAQDWSWERQAGRYEELYRRLLGRPASAATG